MNFISLDSKSSKVNFETAVWDGLATDGGMYSPEYIPKFSSKESAQLLNQNFSVVAYKTLSKWLQEDIKASQLKDIVNKAFNFDIPIVDVGPYKVVELFHGPTLAFKDVAARFLAQYFSYCAAKNKSKINIVVATSGDTGGAIANAFGGIKNIRVYILFPKNRVSKLQKEQLTRCDYNIEPIELEGTFDDCQSLVKQALRDKSLNISITSANSINIGRLLPQITYYTYITSQISDYEAVIPTGNLGNATAGLIANQMRFGPKHITLACNSNDSIYKYYKTGKYTPKDSVATISNAMDVGDPNNFARFTQPFNNSVDKFRRLVDVFTVDDKQTIKTIKNVFKQHNYLLDPHTAVAWAAAEKSKSKLQKVILSTASPLKFAKEISDKTGIKVDNSNLILKLSSNSPHYKKMSNDYKLFKKLLIS